jgi:hypothetical protein
LSSIFNQTFDFIILKYLLFQDKHYVICHIVFIKFIPYFDFLFILDKAKFSDMWGLNFKFAS